MLSSTISASSQAWPSLSGQYFGTNTVAMSMSDNDRVGYGISHWDSARGTYYGWRVSMALQFIPESIFLFGVLLCVLKRKLPLSWR